MSFSISLVGQHAMLSQEFFYKSTCIRCRCQEISNKNYIVAMRVITIILNWSKALQDREVTADEGLDLVKRVCGTFNLPLNFKF